jgi:diacylglycerol kinase family enzyme
MHAQQNFDYKGTKTWTLSPYVTDPDRFMHIPEKWDGTVVVLGYGITHINEAGAMELECLTTSSAASAKAAKIWFPNSAITGFSPECSYSASGNKRSKPGGLEWPQAMQQQQMQQQAMQQQQFQQMQQHPQQMHQHHPQQFSPHPQQKQMHPQYQQ